MKVLNWGEINELAVRQVGLPAVYVSNRLTYTDPKDGNVWRYVMAEMKTIYGDGTKEFHDVLLAMVHSGMFFFDDEDQQQRFYQVFNQPLTYSSGIYACTYSADGQSHDENT
jgi:hypothetical protein